MGFKTSSALLNAQMERIWEEKTKEMKLFHEKLVSEKCSSLDEIDYQEVENEIRHCFSKFVVRMDEDKSLMCRYIEKSTVTSILSKVTLHVMEQLECAILLLQKIEPSHIKPIVSVIQRLSKLDGFERELQYIFLLTMPVNRLIFTLKATYFSIIKVV